MSRSVDKNKEREIGVLPLMFTAQKSLWYLPVSRDGPHTDPIVLMRHFLRKSLHSALKGATAELLRDRADEITKDALRDGYSEFDCWVDLYGNNDSIVLRFLNAQKDAAFTRRLSSGPIAKRFGVVFTLEDLVDLKILVQARVLNTEGVECRRHNLPRKRLAIR